MYCLNSVRCGQAVGRRVANDRVACGRVPVSGEISAHHPAIKRIRRKLAAVAWLVGNVAGTPATHSINILNNQIMTYSMYITVYKHVILHALPS